MSITLMSQIWPLQFRPKGDKFVLLALADAANDDGVTWIAVRSRKAGKMDLMKKCSMSDRGIQGAISRLVEQGFLDRAEKPGKGVIYVVRATPENSSGLTPEISATTPEISSGKSSYKHLEEKKGSAELAVDKLGSCPLSGISLPDKLSDRQWNAYREMRSRIGKPVTRYISELLLDKLDQISKDGWHVGDICDRATINGWTDFFSPSKQKPSGVRRVVGDHVAPPVGATNEDVERIREIDALDDMAKQLEERASYFRESERRNGPSSLGSILGALPLDFDPRKTTR